MPVYFFRRLIFVPISSSWSDSFIIPARCFTRFPRGLQLITYVCLWLFFIPLPSQSSSSTSWRSSYPHSLDSVNLPQSSLRCLCECLLASRRVAVYSGLAWQVKRITAGHIQPRGREEGRGAAEVSRRNEARRTGGSGCQRERRRNE